MTSLFSAYLHKRLTDDCAELLAKDEAINIKLEATVLTAIDELPKYE